MTHRLPRCFPFRGGLGLLAWVAALAVGASAAESAPLVDAQTRLAIVGDSITEQRQYTRVIEGYLLACAPTAPEAVMQFGWSGERAPGFAKRMARDLTPFRPTLMTLAYGMNDGGYKPFEEKTGENYRAGMRSILDQAKEAGVRVLVGGPGAVDRRTFKRPGAAPDVYNDTLRQLNDIARELAKEYGFPFADIHAACIEGMDRAREALGEQYTVMGGDGVHPGANGQFLMAYGFLRAMGLSGEIGQLTVNMAPDHQGAGITWGPRTSDVPEAEAPHTLAVDRTGDRTVFTLRSRRWPFAVFGDADKNKQTPRAILPFTKFSEELNRFTLHVIGLPKERALVQWGQAKRIFTREELQKGVNLADAFAGETPFQEAWKQLDRAIQRKQALETWMVKQVRAQDGVFNPLRDAKSSSEAVRTGVDQLDEAITRLHTALAAEVKAALVPVEHTVEITPLDAE